MHDSYAKSNMYAARPRKYFALLLCGDYQPVASIILRIDASSRSTLFGKNILL
jgi:hypothetical protein